MRVLVTGANGFVGRHVVDYILRATDWTIAALDIDDKARSDDPRVVFFQCDLSQAALPDIEIDAVIHLASAADVSEFLAEPVPFVRANVEMTLRLLEWARDRPITHFVQVSTNEVYGPSCFGEAMTEWSPIAPPTPYSASKAAQEALAYAWWYSYDVPTVILTTMHVFGEEQPATKFIPATIKRLKESRPVWVYAQGQYPDQWESAQRNWTYVGDLADAIVWVLGRPAVRRAMGRRPNRWNVVGPVASLADVTQQLAKILGVKAEIEHVDVRTARPGHELVYKLDGTEIGRAGWHPVVGFETGLARTVEASP